MCDGSKIPVIVREYGLEKNAIRCIMCGTYEFEKDGIPDMMKCQRHGNVYCGICERVKNRKIRKEMCDGTV